MSEYRRPSVIVAPPLPEFRIGQEQKLLSPQTVADIIGHSPRLLAFAEKQTGNNTLAIREDETAVEARIGDWFAFKLRDRYLDGPRFTATALTQWPYSGADDIPIHQFSVEESTYWLDPNHPLTDRFAPDEVAFINNPFEAIPYGSPNAEELRRWHDTFAGITVRKDAPPPGYFSLKNIPGIRREILAASTAALRELGYQELTAVPTWFHTSSMYEHLGFHYQNLRDAAGITALHDRLKEHAGADNHHERPDSYRSWLAVYQFWARLAEQNGFIPEELAGTDQFVLRNGNGTIVSYPLTPQHNLWMRKEI